MRAVWLPWSYHLTTGCLMEPPPINERFAPAEATRTRRSKLYSGTTRTSAASRAPASVASVDRRGGRSWCRSRQTSRRGSRRPTPTSCLRRSPRAAPAARLQPVPRSAAQAGLRLYPALDPCEARRAVRRAHPASSPSSPTRAARCSASSTTSAAAPAPVQGPHGPPPGRRRRRPHHDK